VKVNSDAAFYADGHNGAMAHALCDTDGAVREAQATWYDRVYDACIMEALC
jgi:hypothetical protein